jgi:hypothetical protein
MLISGVAIEHLINGFVDFGEFLMTLWLSNSVNIVMIWNYEKLNIYVG